MKHLKRYKIFESNKMISEDDIRSILFEFTDNNDFVIDIEKTSPIEKGLSIMYGYNNKYNVKIYKHPLKKEDARLTQEMMDALNTFIDILKSENFEYKAHIGLIRVDIKDNYISDYLVSNPIFSTEQGDLEINIGDKISNLRFECIQYRN
jgi:hypothetical protein